MLLAGCAPDRTARLQTIGEYLCRQAAAGNAGELATATDIPGLESVQSPAFGALFAALQPALDAGYTVAVTQGPRFNTGDGTSDRILITTGGKKYLLLLHYDSKTDKFRLSSFPTSK